MLSPFGCINGARRIQEVLTLGSKVIMNTRTEECYVCLEVFPTAQGRYFRQYGELTALYKQRWVMAVGIIGPTVTLVKLIP